MPLIFWHFEVQILAFWLYEIDPKCFFWTCFGVRYQLEHLRCCCDVAAVSCSPTGARLGGVKLGTGVTGKLGHAWVGVWVCAWHGAWVCAWYGTWVCAWHGAWMVVVVVM